MGTIADLERGLSIMGFGEGYTMPYEGFKMLQCPLCMDLYAHIDGVTHEKGEGSEEIYISFWGECHHRWGITFSHDKGNTFIYLDIPEQGIKQ